MILLVSFQGCTQTPKIQQTEPQHLDYGKSGQQPEKVWKDYDWVIVDSDKYIIIKR